MGFSPESDSKFDGRWIAMLFLILYFTAIFVSSFYTDYDQFWADTFRVCTSRPRFLDMHHLTSGLECHRLGYDVLRQNPCEPNKLPMTYPRIWLNLAALGIDQSHSDLLGVLCAMLYFLCAFFIAGKLNTIEGIFYGVILCSPSLMLAVETGNIDLIIFILLSAALLLIKRNRAFSYLIIFFAAVLKYFPISALLVAVKERKRLFWLVGLLIAMFAAYIYFTYDEALLIHSQVQRSTYISFGGFILFRILHHLTHEVTPLLYWRIAFVGTVGAAIVIAYLQAARKRTLAHNVDSIDGFRMTAGIFITSFLLWDNWDYRFIFLVFALPQMWKWIRVKDPLAPITAAALVGIPMTLWLSGGCPPEMNFHTIRSFFVDELINWFLFYYFVYALMATWPYNEKAR
ncbi:MAG TPA: glycosyltransferase 87 family protein [Acidobacteriota bacterium]|nr:glycosyltransferase 87 family protein [Acidobacteriota bacterium]